MKQINKAVHDLAWKQWDHRDKVLHGPEGPREQNALAALNTELENELMRGVENLPPQDRGSFCISLPSLLGRSKGFKKNWLEAVHSARSRQATREDQLVDPTTVTLSRQDIRNWFGSNRWRHWS